MRSKRSIKTLAEYLFRLADAAKNAGVRDRLVIKTYALGDMISNRIGMPVTSR